MAKLTGNERLAGIREEVLVVTVKESVSPTAKERLVRMHARAVLTEQWLGHEGRVKVVLLGVLLDCDSVGHAVVSHLQGICVAHVDLML